MSFHLLGCFAFAITMAFGIIAFVRPGGRHWTGMIFGIGFLLFLASFAIDQLHVAPIAVSPVTHT